MAGFYVHIPFCRKVCYYCDFHFVATLKYKDEMLKALHREIELRSKEWQGTTFETLYFGGGTPSVLSVEEIKQLCDKIFEHYRFNNAIEFTLEANPDDLNAKYLKALSNQTNINRLSIGTQSFRDKDLKLMNRRHNGSEAIDSIKNAQNIGFSNLNIDLIYGTPGLSEQGWRENIETFLRLQAPHLSAYHLAFEPKTVFDHFRKKNKLQPVEDSISQKHYAILTETLKANEFSHYEISNFAKQDAYSQHNTNYWLGSKYIGIGPSAHSFNGNTRCWNVANNTQYCKNVLSGNSEYQTTEELTKTDRFNEYLLTSLRTHWGVDYAKIEDTFGSHKLRYLQNTLQKFKEQEQYTFTSKGFKLNEQAWLISDYIIRELFYQND